MNGKLVKPYEISVWEDKPSQNGDYIEEVKLAVIGSDKMVGLNKVYDPVFNKKHNGERTLTFSLKYKYYDSFNESGETINPFVKLLTNERKIKLYYDDKWYEFIVKDHTESTEEYTWTYTCSDAYVLELSKTGYNVTFSAELNNNQGTARELAGKTIKDTSWRLGETDPGKQFVAEPIYKAVLAEDAGITIINASGNGEEVPEAPTNIYLFYSYVKNKSGKFVQFIIRNSSRPYSIDDKNVITDTNFRITTDLVFDSNTNSFKTEGGTTIITIDSVETLYQANRLVYKQLNTYDSVMERTVDVFKAGDREIYRYIDYSYTTSNVVVNYLTNGENFNVLEDGSTQGWNPYVETTEPSSKITKLEMLTKPQLGTNIDLVDLDSLSEIEGFLKVHFYRGLTTRSGKLCNLIYNSGFSDNASLIGSITKGEKFVFRWRAGTGGINNLTGTKALRLLVAEYTQDIPAAYGYYYKHIKPSDVIIQFEGTSTKLNNVIEGGTISNNKYYIDGVEQTVSTKYTYKSGNKYYAWNQSTKSFVEANDSNYLPYYYVTATAQKSVSNKNLTDPTKKYGIFLYSIADDIADTGRYYYIQDIQFFRFVPDAADPTGETPVLIGNVPVAETNSKEYYYLKPTDTMVADEIETYATAAELKSSLNIPEDIVPVYNEDSVKYLSIEASQSNCFDILQTIAETFECWIDLDVRHDNRGAVIYDEYGPQKFVNIRQFAGKDNYAGFKYGINLESIERNVNSDEIVTKLIVDQAQSEYTDEGFVSIGLAKSNTSGESYILNFNYLYGQQLLDRESTEADRLEFAEATADLNTQIQEKETKRRELELSLESIGSKRNVYTELIETAKETKSEALALFQEASGMTYEAYTEKHKTIGDDDKLTEEDTIYDILGDLYVSSATINSYSGLLTNTEQEYQKVRKELYGYENFSFKVWADIDYSNQWHVYLELTDYLPGFSFTIGGSTYESTVSKKYFDIITDAKAMTFTAPTGYMVDSASYTVNRLKTAKFRITSTTTTSIIGIKEQIEDLQREKDDLTKDFNNKYSRYLQEGTWSSTEYIDSELYYLDALQVSNTSSQPVVSYTINVLEISRIEGYEWYSFDAGDKSYIEDTEFFGWTIKNGVLTPAREEVIVSEVEWHLDEPDKNVVTVQNYKTRFEDLFQRISATVQTVQYNEATYAKITSLLDLDGNINANVLLDSLNGLGGREYNLTSNGSIVIQNDSIYIKNLNNTANRVIINSEGIKVSSDGGNTWTTAIDGQGINIGSVYTGTLNTNEVIIGSKDNPGFRWDKSGISAYGTKEEIIDGSVVEVSDLKTYVRYDQYGLYGIKNNSTFKAQSIEDIKEKAHFAVTWDGFFINNSYKGGGKVSLTSLNDFQITKLISNDGLEEEQEKIKIGALKWDYKASEDTEADISKIYYRINEDGDLEEVTEISPTDNPRELHYYEQEQTTIPQPEIEPSLYGLRISNNIGEKVVETGDDGNITITGTINALGGNFKDLVTVGKQDDVTIPYIEIDGREERRWIQSSDYGSGMGWRIDSLGDAYFNNINARGSIKTAVFEYAEIQAVGGIMIFRPSSTIDSVEQHTTGSNDLIITVKKPYLFKVGDWCKVSNYIDSIGEPRADSSLLSNGLTHVYRVKAVDQNNSKILTLENAYNLVEGNNKVVDNKQDLVGGALVNMGSIIYVPSTDTSVATGKIYYQKVGDLYEVVAEPSGNPSENGYYENDLNATTTNNYGIGINSSDNSINLPRRSISLFETKIDESISPKVYYDYKAILGTLPDLNEGIDRLVYSNMVNTQGIYTNNMYIGDDEQYIAFYKDKNDNGTGKLDIKGNVYVGDYELSSVVNISNGSISLGDPNGFHIYIDGNGQGSQHYDEYTHGLGFYQSDHTPYQLTADTSVVSEKNYYEYNELNGKYEVIVSPSGNPKQKGWYERVDKRIAYINDNKLSIPYTVVLKGMEVGNEWIWELQPDSKNLTLKWIGN